MPYKDPEKQKRYLRQHHSNNPEKYAASRKNYRIQLRDDIAAVKETRGRMDCKQPYPYFVLDFDHREGVEKLNKVQALIRSARREIVLAEIEKCDVVCANCHRIRTHERQQQVYGS